MTETSLLVLAVTLGGIRRDQSNHPGVAEAHGQPLSDLGRRIAAVRTAMEALNAASRAAGSAIYLGEGARGWAWAGRERPTLVLGPTRSGKTTCVIIPNVLAAPGAVVSTSTKPDVMETTANARAQLGCPLLYDPTGAVETERPVLRVGWSPVNACREWDGAISTADAMVRSAQRAEQADHWSERARALLAPLLFAAALSDEPMSTVLSWVDRHVGEDALERLDDRHGDSHPASAVLAGILSTDPREQSGIWSTASGVLAAYRSLSTLRSTRPPFLDVDDFLGGTNTLYICAPGRMQELVAPLVVGLLSELRDAAYRRELTAQKETPVLFALDEVANIAPLPDLSSIVTEGAGQGLLTLACLQDLSQARQRWGRAAEGFLSIFGCTLVFPGIADMPTLDALSQLAGDVETSTRTVGTGRAWDGRRQPSLSISTIFRRRLSVDVIARGRPLHTVCLDARNRMGWVKLTPSYESPPWNTLLQSERSIGPIVPLDPRQPGLPQNAPARSRDR